METLLCFTEKAVQAGKEREGKETEPYLLANMTC